MANVNLGKVALTPKGNWDNTITYEKLDVVQYDGNSYIAKTGVPVGISVTTGTEYWQLFFAKGNGISVGDVIIASTTQPTVFENKLWIREGSDEEYDVLTTEDINNIQSDLLTNVNIINIINQNDGLSTTYNGITGKIQGNKIILNGTATGNCYIKLTNSLDSYSAIKTIWKNEQLNLIQGHEYLFVASHISGNINCINEETQISNIISLYTTSYDFNVNRLIFYRKNFAEDKILNNKNVFYGDNSFIHINDDCVICIILQSGTIVENYTLQIQLIDLTLKKQLLYDNNIINDIFKISNKNLFNPFLNPEYISPNTKFISSINKITIINIQDSASRGLYYYYKLKPNTKYTFSCGKIDSLTDGYWIGYANSIDDEGKNYPSGNTVGISQSKGSSFSFTTTTGYVRFLLMSSGSSSPFKNTVTFYNIMLVEGNNINNSYEPYKFIPKEIIEQENLIIENDELWNYNNLHFSQTENYTIYENGLRYYNTSDVSYGTVYKEFILEPDTLYTLSFNIIQNILNNYHPWVGLKISTDEGQTYPSGNKVLLSIIQTEENPIINFNSGSGYIRLSFYAKSGSAPFDISINNISLQKTKFKKIYELPENISVKSEISAMKNTKQALGDMSVNNHNFNILFFTDCHYQSTRVKRIKELVNNWGNELIDCVLFGGDMNANIISVDTDWYYNALDKLSVPLLNTLGNHDIYKTNNNTDGLIIEDSDKIYNKIIAPIVESSIIVQPENAASNYLCYYYKDFNNIRIIVIDCMRWDNNQKTWFESVLSDAITNNKKVICSSHISFLTDYVDKIECSWSKYYHSMPNFKGWNTSPEAAIAIKDFIDNGGTFITWLMGHSHTDTLCKLKSEYGNQLVILCSADTNQQARNLLSEDPDEYTYDALTSIIIDENFNLIKVRRIGSGFDVFGNNKKGFVYNYQTNELIDSW